MKKRLLTVLSILCFLAAGSAAAAKNESPSAPAAAEMAGTRPNGSVLKLDYSLTDDLGSVKAFAVDDSFTAFAYDASGSYKLERTDGQTSYFLTPTRLVFDVKPNRKYLVSALVYCDFDRAESEINVGLRIGNENENQITLIDGFHGLPSDTGGKWLRFETTVTTPYEAAKARFYGAWYGFGKEDEAFYIADIEVSELAVEEIIPLGVGEGLEFGGSSGMFDMSVLPPVSEGNNIRVMTNGAQYSFDKSAGTITVSQRIGNPRGLAEIKTNKPLTDLRVLRADDKAAVLTTGEGGLSFGIQMDGLMLISAHGDDAEITLTSKIGGKWNRLLCGNLIAMDDTGGFTVNPALVSGSGRTPDYSVISGVDFERERGDTEFISGAKPGWSISWTVKPGERLGVTAFPPREYDWENSFDSALANIDFGSGTEIWQNYKTKFDLRYGVLWSSFKGAYAMSWGDKYIPKDETKFRAHIAAAKAADVRPLEYMSMFFWDGTLDGYINEVIRHRDEYGIEGIYTDGVPPIDWLKAYEGMRLLREVFPNGCIVEHTTGQSANGGAPLAAPEIFIPAIDAYATFTLRGESVRGTAKDWAYQRYVTKGFGASNTFGLQKYDAWTVDGKNMQSEEQQLLQLLYNGRARYDAVYSDGYKNILAAAQKQWQASGAADGYFEKCYLPYVRRLVRKEHAQLEENGAVSAYGFTEILNKSFEAESGGALEIGKNNGYATEILPCFGKTEMTLNVKVSEASQLKIDIFGSNGENAVSLLQTGNLIRFLGRKGGYTGAADIETGDYIELKLCADPAEGRFDLFADGVKIADGKAFSNAAAAIGRISLSAENSAYIKSVNVKSGL